ncbi:hypothetical protein ACTXT7_014720 [Hymenolepis weldensis]
MRSRQNEVFSNRLQIIYSLIIYETLTICHLPTQGEALRLAKDFNYICENEFPLTACADALIKNTPFNTPSAILTRRNQILAARHVFL